MRDEASVKGEGVRGKGGAAEVPYPLPLPPSPGWTKSIPSWLERATVAVLERVSLTFHGHASD